MPTFSDAALTTLIVGLLFIVRFALASRRLMGNARPGGSHHRVGWALVRRKDAYGSDLEPERRHAVRQLYFGLSLIGFSALLGIWLLVSPALTATG